jgi:UDP-N-acetylglucosamine 2-epimerase (non-hydrolysing)
VFKIATILGTRPEIIRLSRIISELDIYFDQIIIHTGQNYDFELNEIFFQQLNIRKPDYYLNAAGKNSAETIGKVIIESDKLLSQLLPNCILILGDTNSSFAAISAKRLKIPIFHFEAGNRCFDLRVPEEINRKVIDHISDVNLTYTQIAKSYLLREGFSPDQVISIGSPMKEVINYYSEEINNSQILKILKLKAYSYFLVSFHREENVDSRIYLNNFLEILKILELNFQLPIIVSTHPRTRKMLERNNFKDSKRISFLPPFGYFDYVNLQINSLCVLSDSGTITEESSILNFPALNLRDMHERPEGFEEGSVMFVGLSKERIFQALNILLSQKRGNEREIKIVRDYDTELVSKKVIRIILSYTDYIKRVVWKQY